MWVRPPPPAPIIATSWAVRATSHQVAVFAELCFFRACSRGRGPWRLLSRDSDVTPTRAEWISAIQARCARVAVGPSTARGQGAPGLVHSARQFLGELQLGLFGTRSAVRFSSNLDRMTANLMPSPDLSCGEGCGEGCAGPRQSTAAATATLSLGLIRVFRGVTG